MKFFGIGLSEIIILMFPLFLIAATVFLMVKLLKIIDKLGIQWESQIKTESGKDEEGQA